MLRVPSDALHSPAGANSKIANGSFSAQADRRPGAKLTRGEVLDGFAASDWKQRATKSQRRSISRKSDFVP